MKRFCSFLCTAILCLGMLSSFHARAVDNSVSSNEELFSLAMESDAEVTQSVSIQLYQNLLADPQAFLDDLSECSEEIQDTVGDFLTWEAYWSEGADAYQTALQTVDGPAQTLAADLLAQLDAYAGEQETPDSSASETAMPAFHPDTVKLFIDSNLAVSDPYTDEEFCKKVAEWYAADPVMFSEMLDEYSDAEVSRLGKQISYAVVKQGAKLPQEPALETLTADTQQTLSRLQASIQEGLEDTPFEQRDFPQPDSLSAIFKFLPLALLGIALVWVVRRRFL